MKRYNSYFILSLILFLVLNILLTINYQNYLYGVNTGTIAFFTIAQKYIRGDFYDAVVGGFGPLNSWLLIPFLKLGLSPMVSLSIVKLIVGLLTLIGTRSLSYKLEMTDNIRNAISFAAVPIVLQFTLTEHIPDLLIVCAVIYYLDIIFSASYPDKAYKGMLCGVAGAIGYFGKSFMFPFFISHFTMLNILHYCRAKDKKVLRNTMLGFILFFVISAPWMIALSNKYNTPTFDSSGAYNHRIRGPEIPKITEYYGWEGWRNFIRAGHPVYDQGFFPPPNDSAISIWEDFTLLTPYLNTWSPFDSWSSFKYQLGIIGKNIYYTIGIFESYFSIFSGAILIGYTLLYLIPFRLRIFKDHRLYPLLTLLLYSGGYLLVFPNVRYLWVNSLLILLMGGHILNELFNNELFNKARRNLLITFFILSFIVLPLKEAVITPNYDKDFWLLGEKLQKYNELTEKKIASNDKFSETLKMLFYSDLKVKYYGQAKTNISDEELQGELKKYDIDYYLVWDDSSSKEVPRFLSDSLEITGGIFFKDMLSGKISGFKIYSLNKLIR
ncbi:hypothetical protein C4544_03365 [candidate division WS5 bacterium]|uniref:Glycosyltransferase RgtA/B/C/D-like domain-containing protein n=1 Tax=candidate division WS5 bacterium TaxID=2093353 RepID=A0A419DDR9_9BACT|nr:MAG: hypothetical protein C4544_03365 [candidate division WS5 bacterium]